MTTNTDLNSQATSIARRRFLKYVAFGAAGAALGAVGANAFSSLEALAPTAKQQPNTFQFDPTGTPSGINVVLVHGIWADSTSYSRVIPLLLEAGHTVFAPQLPLTTGLADDANATLGVLQQVQGPTVLVGHSYGGVVITQVGLSQPDVIGLVYCSAFAPDLGEVLGQFPPGPGTANLYPVTYPNNYGTFLWLNQQKFRESFAQDVDPPTAAIMARVQKPANVAHFGASVTSVAWKTIPSWYLISGEDQMIPPTLQQMFANRMNATTDTIATSSHASIVSHPHEVFELIQAAAGASKSTPTATTAAQMAA
jgi:pimeloyl-ACP methyl ester carboxylesterase